MKSRKLLFIAIIILGVITVSCRKMNDNSTMARLTIRLTDAAADYEKINIDIIGVQAIINDDKIDLEAQTGVYNLLDYVNGKDTIIVDQEIPAGMLSQIRLILGPENSLLIAEDTYDLKTPSAQQSGLKLNIHQEFVPGIAYEYVIDFDAGKSIVKTGNGKFILKPVIKVLSEAVSGAIEGVVFPVDAKPLIYAISESEDTSSTFSDEISGKFMFRGLPEGSYYIDFVPLDPYSDSTLKDILVKTGEITRLDTLKFQ